ncbi:hypothetical protein EDD36DRAFT_414436 [Exophiala viscosa]|uniref:DUF6536 domain-containing protein n=1 Tax=Exophiala viscosa TaxID=2486360 RepID=A0AAN6E6J6_9EURO|nr:hypothetical protein EDD36DRAFT_414436 [Exophiala viscosa]
MTWQTKGVIFCSLVCTLCLVLWVYLLATFIKSHSSQPTTLFSGNCDIAGNINIGLHLVITIFSVSITVSSDFFMRLVSAPQAADIREAHRQATWMDVGINSIRNLRSIPRWRSALWIVGAASSIPLSLFFQASVIGTAATTEYDQLLVSEGFLDGDPFVLPWVGNLLQWETWRFGQPILEPLFREIQANVSGFHWKKFDSVECRKTYLASRYGLRFYRHLVIVIEAGPNLNPAGWTNDQVWSGTVPPSYSNTSYYNYASLTG